MSEVQNAVALLAILIASAGLGMLVRSRLPERHTGRESIELIQLSITMLVTFASIVLGLLTYSVKGSFDASSNNMAALAGRVVRLDQCLRNYGSEGEPTRALLGVYTTSVIATTWPSQAPAAMDHAPRTAVRTSPHGMESVKLGEMLDHIGLMITSLQPEDAFHRQIAADCRDRFQDLMQARWLVIEQAHPTISRPFYLVLIFWLAVIFACFGLSAPRSGLVIAMMTLCAISITSAVYVVLDMDTPFTGLLAVSSEPMRSALADISR